MIGTIPYGHRPSEGFTATRHNDGDHTVLNVPIKPSSTNRKLGSVGAGRLAASGAIVLALLFTGSWFGTQLPYGPTDLMVELFTSSPPSSTDALAEGVLWAALFGFISGGLLAVVYNALGLIDRM